MVNHLEKNIVASTLALNEGVGVYEQSDIREI
jgi:hypothetical protein